MYSMEKLARGTILTKEQREFKEKRWNECKARMIKNSDFRNESSRQDPWVKFARRDTCVKFAEYKDRPRGKIKEG